MAAVLAQDLERPEIVFFGTPAFAVPTLDALKQASWPIQVVVTQPDRPAGRGQKMTASPVKAWAEKHQVPLVQPSTLKNNQEFLSQLRNWRPRIIVLVAYGLILPPEVLGLAPLGCLNLHPSLLPKYRGASPIETAILNGETETGVTTIQMNERMDAGPILLQKKIAISPVETAGRLKERLSLSGAGLVVETIKGLLDGRITPRPQAEAEASYAPLLKREDGFINWEKPADKICDRIRAFLPKPGPFTYWRDIRLNIVEAGLAEGQGPAEALPGTVLSLDEAGAGLIAARPGRILLKKVRPAGGHDMTLGDFARGHDLPVGARLGYRELTAIE